MIFRFDTIVTDLAALRNSVFLPRSLCSKTGEMALLAPTAINQQRFEISLETDGSVTFSDKGGPFSKVDLGIVKYHFEVGTKAKRAE